VDFIDVAPNFEEHIVSRRIDEAAGHHPPSPQCLAGHIGVVGAPADYAI
jgi:hypothetical protein